MLQRITRTITFTAFALSLCHCSPPPATDAGEDVATTDDAMDSAETHDATVDTGQDIALDAATDAPADIVTDATSSGSCNLPTRSLCEDFVNAHVGPYMASCMSMGGTWSNDACTHTGAIGGCQHSSSDGSHTVLWFYDADADVAMTQTQCTASMGMWVGP